MIYLDNAATTYYKPNTVINAMQHALHTIGNAGRGAYGVSLETSRNIYHAREKIADLFCAYPATQVAFTSNATESLNIAIQGLFQSGDHIITTELEHNSVLRPLYLMQERGIQLTIIPANKTGIVCYSDFEYAIRQNTKAIICTHASNVTGNVINLEKVGQLCHKHNLNFIVDASQTAGHLEINMKQMKIDVLCFTGHKSLFGPQGVGGLCVKDGLHIRPLIVGGSGTQTYLKSHPAYMPTALEAGTLNAPGILGLYASLCYLEDITIASIRKKELQLMWNLYFGLKEIPAISIYGDFSTSNRIPIVSINIRDYDSSQVADELFTNYGIATRAGAHCAPLMHKALGTVQQGAVRFSISYFNTEEEINKTIEAVHLLAKE